MLWSVVILFIIAETLMAMNVNRGGENGQSDENSKYCGEVSKSALEEILGPAFNARYMSIQPPSESGEQGNSLKRGAGADLEFYVDSELQEDLEDKPAWALRNHVEATLKIFGGGARQKRDVEYLEEWHCKSRVKWIDLGVNYFPRYLRTIECLQDSCWFNIYTCKPRSFSVKILRRKQNECAKLIESNNKIGTVGLPEELKEMWVWEERAVNFCCDCSA